MAKKNNGFINIHGKQYATVAHRLQEFRKKYPQAQIVTQLESNDGERIIMQAAIIIDDNCIATGWAEEVRGSSMINKTSALENCESSAVGRALAFMGYGIDGSIASAEEVQNAKEQQAVMEEEKITKEQEKALSAFLEDQEDGIDLLEKILNKAGVDHLKELNKKYADKCISTWSITV